jgi:hypothetical protein
MSDLPIFDANLSIVTAVSSLLKSIGVGSIASEDAITRSSDALSAYNVLMATSLEVQSRIGGWYFNTEEDVTLSPESVTGFIKLPANTISVDVHEVYQSQGYVQRGLQIYDRDNQSFNIGKAIKVDMVVALGWDQLPYPAKNLIVKQASIKFAADRPTSAEYMKNLQREYLIALATLENTDADTDDNNMVMKNPHFQKMKRR